jgi:sulfite dehydrogenase (cytochrome) subunit B
VQSLMRGILRGSASAAILFVAFAAQTEPRTYVLPAETAEFLPGPGVETAQGNCLVCHSADYVRMQPPEQGKAFWTAEVNKMIKVFGAPISPEDAAKIVDYLSATY